MRKEKVIKNTNIRMNLLEPEDKEAWDHLQHLDRKQYKSYSRAVVAAVNDFFGRKKALDEDPYLETRKKEDAFLQKVLDAVEKGARDSIPMVMAGNLMWLLGNAMEKGAQPDTWEMLSKSARAQEIPGMREISASSHRDDIASEEDALDDALEFADGL